jgi:drug/metabolite transporter (DMT)-like permease
MNKRALGADILLLLTAGIWGFGFVAQRSGMEYIGPFAFNGIRFLLGSLSLLPLIAWKNCEKPKPGLSGIRTPVFASFLAGTCLFIAVSLQQLGIMFTTAGNAGFITGLYVVLTPIIGIFLGRKTGPATWAGAVFTLIGLYLLSAAGSMDISDPLASLNPGDIITAVSAVFWAAHVLIIDRLVRNTDPIVLSSGQFAFCSVYSLIAAFTAEPFLGSRMETLAGGLPGGLFGWKPFPGLIRGLVSGIITGTFISNALIPILYGGLASVGIAYTLQVVAQRDAPPAHATIILCLEGCFAALGGVLLLHEPLGTWTILGFALMLTGMLASQWEVIAGYQNKAA